MTKHVIHVNRAHIAQNAKDGGNRPVYTIKTGGKTRYAREVEILGPSKMVYDGSQLKCGARAWIEANCEIVLIDEMTFAEAKGQKPLINPNSVKAMARLNEYIGETSARLKKMR